MKAELPRRHRVNIMFSDDELKALDDWRFDNRVCTRPGAIRRLVIFSLSTQERCNKTKSYEKDKRIELLEAENQIFRETEGMDKVFREMAEATIKLLQKRSARYLAALQKIKDRLLLQDVTDEDKVREALEIVEDAFDVPEGSK